MRIWIFTALLLVPLPGLALSKEAQEFMRINDQLEPVPGEKRKLRRELALAEGEKRDADVRTLRERVTALARAPQPAQLERRLAELQPRLERSSDPEDLRAINRQRVEAFYRCG